MFLKVFHSVGDSLKCTLCLYVIAAEVRGNSTETLLAGSLAKALCCILSIKLFAVFICDMQTSREAEHKSLFSYVSTFILIYSW